jgi:hypothetical protein
MYLHQRFEPIAGFTFHFKDGLLGQGVISWDTRHLSPSGEGSEDSPLLHAEGVYGY